MNVYSVVLVDDEMINIEILKKIISTHCLKLEIVGIARTMETAYSEIVAKKPDIVFMDINMREKQIFDVLDKFLLQLFLDISSKLRNIILLIL